MLAGDPHILNLAQGATAGEGLAPLIAVFPGRDFDPLGQGIHHRNADAVQTARGLIRLAGKFSAGVQNGHDHLQRRLAGVFGVRIHGDAATVIADGQFAVRGQGYLDQFGVAGHGLVHRVVQNLREQVMQGALISAADIHAGAFADGLQTLQHLDVLGGVAVGVGGAGRGLEAGSHDRLRRRTEGVVK